MIDNFEIVYIVVIFVLIIAYLIETKRNQMLKLRISKIVSRKRSINKSITSHHQRNNKILKQGVKR